MEEKKSHTKNERSLPDHEEQELWFSALVDWIVYRYADVLTLLAEAIVREGNTATSSSCRT